MCFPSRGLRAACGSLETFGGRIDYYSVVDIEKVPASHLVKRIAAIARQDHFRPRALFTILCGAGVSLGAGMPSTARLVAAMKAGRDGLERGEAPAWSAILDGIDEAGIPQASSSTTAEYQALFNSPEIFPSPLHRQRFISEAIVWASGRRAPVSTDSLRLASILVAGCGRSIGGTSGTQKVGPDRSPRLGRWLAHTLYTTNFDEVIPQTLRYCGEPVVIVDHPGAHGRLQGEPTYPRVAYLHGCHLHYALRNTPAELGRAEADRSGGVDISGLFLRFRDTLRSTGLIVLGYSGWNDRAVRAIQDALADEESLPFGLYWGARFGERSLSDTALQLLRQNPGRAFMLDEGVDVSKTLETICSGLGIPYESNVEQWRSRFSGVHAQFDFIAPASEVRAASNDRGAPLAVPSQEVIDLQRDLEQAQLLSEAATVDANLDGEAVRAWLERAGDFVARERAAGLEPSPQLTFWMGHFRVFTGEYVAAADDLRAAMRRFEEQGAEASAAEVLAILASTLGELGQCEEAEQMALKAAEQLRKLSDVDGYVSSMTAAIKAAIELENLEAAKQRWNEVKGDVDRANPDVRAMLRYHAARLFSRAGELDEAYRIAMAARADATSSVVEGNVIRLIGGIELLRGHFDEAKLWFAQASDISESQHNEVARAFSTVGLIEAQLGAEQRDGLVMLVDRLEVLANVPIPPGSSIYLRSILDEACQFLGRPGDHVAHLKSLLDDVESKGRFDAHLLARSRMTFARMQARAGDTAGAVETVTAVRRDALARVDVLVGRMAEAALQALGAAGPV